MNNYVNDMLRDCSVLAINKSLPFPTIPSDVAFTFTETSGANHNNHDQDEQCH